MPEAHQLKTPHKKNNNSNNSNNKEKMITMMIIVKFLSISTKMDNPNGFVLNSLSPNKTQKSQELGSSTTMITKEPIDSEKEAQALPTQVLKSTVLRKP